MTAAEVLDALRRHWRIPVAAAVVGIIALVAVVVGHGSSQPTYVAASTIRLTTDDVGLPIDLRGSLADQADAATGPGVIADALRRAGAPVTTPVTVTASAVQSDPEHPTNQVVITVETRSERLSARLASTIAAAFLDLRRRAQLPELAARQEALLRRIDTVQARLDQLPRASGPAARDTKGDANSAAVGPTDLVSSERLALQEAVNNLRLAYGKLTALGAVADGGGELVSIEGPNKRAVRSSLSGPLFLLGGLTLLVGLGGAVVAHLLDDSLRGSDAAALMGAPVLGQVPGRRRIRRRRAEPVLLRSGPGQAAFSALAGTLQASGAARQRLLVTSPNGSADLTAVGVNLAAGLAQLGLGVALLGTDPSHLPAFHALGMTEGVGFGDLVEDAASGALNGQLRRSLQQVEDLPNVWVLGPGAHRGPTPMQAVSGLLAALESEQLGIDVAIVVGRPFLDDSDASILASEVGAVLWAFDPQETSREDAEEAARRLELARADAVGIVLATGHA